MPLRPAMIALSSVTLTAIVALAACDSSSNQPTGSGGDGGSGAGAPTTSSHGTGASTSSSSTGGGAPGTCAQAKTMLDVSKAPGAGAEYPKPSVTATCTATAFVVDSNGIPSYTFVATTPNPLKANADHWEIPLEPEVAAQITELPLLGYAGFSVNGLPIFGPNEGPQPVDSAYGDPVYNDLMDACMGHTSQNDYHYHAFDEKCLIPSGLVAEPWMNPDPPAGEPSPILGWAADGFPIYGSRECADAACSQIVVMQSGYDPIGDPTTNAWSAYQWKDHGDATHLDQCNGHVGPGGDYHYHSTATFPYILGCYRGTPMGATGEMMDGGAPTNDGGMTGPKSCSSNADCQGACPPGSLGCTCASSPMGMICAPTCNTDADCPPGPMGMTLTCKQGTCSP